MTAKHRLNQQGTGNLIAIKQQIGMIILKVFYLFTKFMATKQRLNQRGIEPLIRINQKK